MKDLKKLCFVVVVFLSIVLFSFAINSCSNDNVYTSPSPSPTSTTSPQPTATPTPTPTSSPSAQEVWNGTWQSNIQSTDKGTFNLELNWNPTHTSGTGTIVVSDAEGESTAQVTANQSGSTITYGGIIDSTGYRVEYQGTYSNGGNTMTGTYTLYNPQGQVEDTGTFTGNMQ